MLLNTLVTRLTDSCSCRLSVKYVAESNLSCGDRTTDRVILRGSLIGTEGSDSSDLHALLQSWVAAGPSVEVRGIRLTVLPCSTYPGDESNCGSLSFERLPVYSSVAGVVVLSLVAIVVTVVVLVCVRRRKKQKIRRYWL